MAISTTKTNFSRVIDGAVVYYTDFQSLKASMGGPSPAEERFETRRRPNVQGSGGWGSEEDGICNRCGGRQVFKDFGACFRCDGTGIAPGVEPTAELRAKVRDICTRWRNGGWAPTPKADLAIAEEVTLDLDDTTDAERYADLEVAS